MLAGKNVTPCFHLPASIVSIIQIGKDGSNMAIPVFANVIAPAMFITVQVNIVIYTLIISYFEINTYNKLLYLVKCKSSIYDM